LLEAPSTVKPVGAREALTVIRSFHGVTLQLPAALARLFSRPAAVSAAAQHSRAGPESWTHIYRRRIAGAMAPRDFWPMPFGLVTLAGALPCKQHSKLARHAAFSGSAQDGHHFAAAVAAAQLIVVDGSAASRLRSATIAHAVTPTQRCQRRRRKPANGMLDSSSGSQQQCGRAAMRVQSHGWQLQRCCCDSSYPTCIRAVGAIASVRAQRIMRQASERACGTRGLALARRLPATRPFLHYTRARPAIATTAAFVACAVSL
jgi:hypothetical protein